MTFVTNLNSNVLINTLSVNCAEVLQGVCNVENSPPSKRVAAARSDNVGVPVRDGVGVDAKR